MNARSRSPLAAGLAIVAMALLTGCEHGVPSPADTDTPAAVSAPVADRAPLSIRVLNGGKANVGSELEAVAKGLPRGRSIELVWDTVTGGWVIDGHRFGGKRFAESARTIARGMVDDHGEAAFRFRVPEDYGGVHEVSLVANGEVLARGGIEVGQTFAMEPTHGPVGTAIEIRVTGLGWRTMESTWVVNWNNQAVGWVSATGTRGSAVARFRATGATGPQAVKVYTGYMGQSYLNHEQAPNAHLPRPEFVFNVTPGAPPPAAYAEPYQPQVVPTDPERAPGVAVSIAPQQGPVQTKVTIGGSGLPSARKVSLVWETQAGNRVSGAGFDRREVPLGEATTGSDGSLTFPFVIPDDLGGLHAVLIREGPRTLARTHFVIETSVVGISPSSGPAGTPVRIHLKGVGWTDYDNIYVVNYDNAYMGYVCGFNSQGDVVMNFVAAGEPGYHLIDLYPGIYQGPEEGQQLYRLPQLTYSTDHPGNLIPALRFAFEVTR